MRGKKRHLSSIILVLLLLIGTLALGGCEFLEVLDGDDEYIIEEREKTEYTTAGESEEDTEEETEEKTKKETEEETEYVTTTEAVTKEDTEEDTEEAEEVTYYFRSKKLKNQHYEKHGKEMGFDSADEYELAASKVVNNPDVLHKIEAEDGDDVYYLEATNEFVVISTDGYLRTYFNPSGGKKYFDKQ